MDESPRVPNNNTSTWTYDVLDRVYQVTNAFNCERTSNDDAAGNVRQRIERNGRVTKYEYERLLSPV